MLSPKDAEAGKKEEALSAALREILFQHFAAGSLYTSTTLTPTKYDSEGLPTPIQCTALIVLTEKNNGLALC